jgi:prepilin-type N-terminal cleavage/methylation domain-containing protein
MIKNKKGFTLIEVLVVCAIVGIMSAVILVMMSSGNRQKNEVQVAAREVAAAVREAQNYALNGKNASASCGNQYTFIPSNGYASYSITGCVTANYTLKNGVVFTTGDTVRYDTPHAGMTPNSTVTITVSKNSITKNVCVYISGRIVEQDGAC